MLSPDVIALSIGNVRWCDSDTAATTSGVRSAIRAAVQRGADPAEALVEGNLFLCKSDRFFQATAILALLDTTRRVVTLANAGHPSPLMVCAERSKFLTYTGTALPLGADEAFVPPIHSLSVAEETLLVFYTVGMAGDERSRLRAAVRLRKAATYAYRTCSLPTASTIERHMFSPGRYEHDASILTAWTPAAA